MRAGQSVGSGQSHPTEGASQAAHEKKDDNYLHKLTQELKLAQKDIELYHK